MPRSSLSPPLGMLAILLREGDRPGCAFVRTSRGTAVLSGEPTSFAVLPERLHSGKSKVDRVLRFVRGRLGHLRAREDG